MSIYDRQESMGLKTNISIAVIGCGGVGFHFAKMATMSGIEKIYVYDDDVIEESNLNRLDVPMKVIGMNKAMLIKNVINMLRPETSVYAFPYKFSERTYQKVDWIIDCTDSAKTQLMIQDVARKNCSRYMKVGYNGEHMTLANTVAEWGDAPGGYTIIPSWVVPSVVVAALGVGKLLKYHKNELSANIKDLYK